MYAVKKTHITVVRFYTDQSIDDRHECSKQNVWSIHLSNGSLAFIRPLFQNSQ